MRKNEAETQTDVVAAHSDYFFQAKISNFSLSYAVGSSSSSTSSSLLATSLKSLDVLYFNNLACPHCPIAASELVLSLDVSDFSVRSSLRFVHCAM